jgi:hypothetical protein
VRYKHASIVFRSNKVGIPPEENGDVKKRLDIDGFVLQGEKRRTLIKLSRFMIGTPKPIIEM